MVEHLKNLYKKIFKDGLTRYQSSRLRAVIDKVLLYSTIIIFFAAIYEIGFLSDNTDTTWLHSVYYGYLVFYFIFFSTKMPSILKNRGRGQKIYMFVIRIILFVLLTVYLFNVNIVFDTVHYHGIIYKFLTSPDLVYLIILATFFIEISKNAFGVLVSKIRPEALFALSFIVIIFVGAGLLKLPNAAIEPISFVDCLFMATSATSITGLQCIDAGEMLTPLGQGILLVLLQIGGLGVMTFTCFIAYFFKDTSSFKANAMLGNMVGSEGMGSALKMILTIVIYTFTIEIGGAIAIFFSIDYCETFPTINDKIYFSIFNAISAFCNAGFTTIPGSMTDAALFHNYTLKILISMLAILGGVGFPILINIQNFIYHKLVNIKRVIWDHKRYIHEPRLINVNTKLAAIVSTIIFILGTLAFFILERNNTLAAHHGFWHRLIDSFYYAVMPRSAGFNDIGIETMRISTILLLICQMWIGASPFSTGGGIKTTTFGIAVLDIVSIIQGKDRVEIFRRKIANRTIRLAFAVIIISLIFIALGTFLMSIFEDGNKDINALSMVFETVSAYCTCGLSMGITGSLSNSSKLLLSLLMFLGRVGALTLVKAFFTPVKSLNYMYPKENVYVG
ncbi:MAG: ATPase [Bacteroidales bacterium]|nr:ATPase [Bacteroidales bacterium]